MNIKKSVIFASSILVCLMISTHLFANRYGDTAPIRVGVRQFEPFTKIEGGIFSGFSIEIFNKISDVQGFKASFLPVSNLDTMQSLLAQNKIDIGIGAIPINIQNMQNMSFSFPVFQTGLQMLILDDSKNVPVAIRVLQNVRSIFTSSLLLKPLGILFVLLFLSANAVWFFERKRNPDMFPAAYLTGLWESFWWSAVTITTVGYGDKTPRSPVGRAFALLWMFSGIFLISLFTASVSSSLTVQQFQNTIDSPYDLVGKQACSIKDSIATPYLKKIGVRVFEFDTIDKAYECIKRGLVVALVHDSAALKHFVMVKERQEGLYIQGLGRLVLVNNVFQKSDFGFAFSDTFAHKKRFNLGIIALKETGVYDGIYNRWFGDIDN